MPAQITNYQCPACTGPLQFDGATGKLACEFCSSSFPVAEIEALYAEKDARAAEAQATASGSGEIRPAAGLAADHQMERYKLPLCHEWADRKVRGKPAGG